MAHFTFGSESIKFSLHTYPNGQTGVQAWSEDGPYARISVNIPDAPPLKEGQFYLKHWSENAAIANAMIEQGVIEVVSPQIRAVSGHISALAYEFTEVGKTYR